jgi:hypothetical protein
MSALTGVAQAATVPGPPLDARGIYTDFQAERVTVGWTPPIDDGGAFITAYRVQASRDGVTWVATEESACDPPAPDQQCFPELTVVFSYTLTIYETYVVRVAAFNSSGWGAWSALSPPFTILPGNQPRVLPPRDVETAPILAGITMTWRAPGTLQDASYRVEWSKDGRPWKGTDTTRNTAYTFTGLSAGTYSVRVRTQRYEVEFSEWVTINNLVVRDRQQRVLNFAGLPAHLASPGRTLLVPCGLVTNAGQRVRVQVRWELLGPTTRGSIDPVVVKRRPCGKVTIILGGQPVRVRVTLSAPAVDRYAELRQMRTYRP